MVQVLGCSANYDKPITDQAAVVQTGIAKFAGVATTAGDAAMYVVIVVSTNTSTLKNTTTTFRLLYRWLPLRSLRRLAA